MKVAKNEVIQVKYCDYDGNIRFVLTRNLQTQLFHIYENVDNKLVKLPLNAKNSWKSTTPFELEEKVGLNDPEFFDKPIKKTRKKAKKK